MKVRSALEIADRLLSWQMLEDASEVLQRSLEEHPYDPRLLQRLGKVRLAQGRPRDAAPLLERALAHHKMMAPMRASLGTVRSVGHRRPREHNFGRCAEGRRENQRP